MHQISLSQYNMVHTGIYQEETFPFNYNLVCTRTFQVKFILVHELGVNHLLTWYLHGCSSTLLACVKAVESQRPKGTPIPHQTETIDCLSAGAALRPPRRGRWSSRARSSSAWGGGVAAAKPRTRISMATLSGSTNLYLRSRARATSNLKMPS
jgi:hypothetical protein